MSSNAVATGEHQLEIVSFSIGSQAFCLEISHVLEIRGWTPTTVLPHAPDYVKGLMNLRGTVLPVVDLSLRLGLGVTEPTARHVVIIVFTNGQTVGLLVEAVSDILTVSPEEMMAAPDVSGGELAGCIRGVFARDEELMRAIDLKTTLPFLATGEAG